MLVSDFDYILPEDRIAKFPPQIRGETNLLVLNRQTGALTDSKYKNLADFLNPGDILVLNDTKVMRSRLFCAREQDGKDRELVVLENHNGQINHVLYRGKLHVGDILVVKAPTQKQTPKSSTKPQNQSIPQIKIAQILPGGIAEVSSDTPLELLAEKFGTVPLPPYLHRSATPSDTSRYQTVWAKHFGSAAAPTASLNMTPELLQKLHQKGIIIAYLTLHVGLGTFLPIRTDNIEDHHMHSEWFNIPEQTLSLIKNKSKNQRIVAVGTTVARTLEFYAQTGQTSGEDNIFIYPGFKFKCTDCLLTNFHAPKSTVLMLASAFAGSDNLRQAYAHALQHDYRFLSYGDSMLIC